MRRPAGYEAGGLEPNRNGQILWMNYKQKTHLAVQKRRERDYITLRESQGPILFIYFVGADKLEHGIDCEDSEDELADFRDPGLEGEDGLDSDRELRNKIHGVAQGNAEGHSFNSNAQMEEILSLQNLPGCVYYGFERKNSSESLRNRKLKNEVGVQVDLVD